MRRWSPPVEQDEREGRLLKLAGRSRKLLVFLRGHRHELFDDGFQSEMEEMYRDTGQGEEPRAPALMCMALLVQGYLKVSDAEAVRLSGTDNCWRMVLGTLKEKGDKPAFSQGGLQQFRERLVRHEMDLRLLERTIELAKKTRGFDWKKLPRTLRVAVDRRPLAGAGQVEDTINLLGHASELGETTATRSLCAMPCATRPAAMARTRSSSAPQLVSTHLPDAVLRRTALRSGRRAAFAEMSRKTLGHSSSGKGGPLTGSSTLRLNDHARTLASRAPVARRKN